ncbi:hypothetical protein BDB01DRAFT_849190 [Pilobolus umbonatus]|nr:hypothetical protein BDB01DRAFT_849190 [Pilobolus umbonatus]
MKGHVTVRYWLMKVRNPNDIYTEDKTNKLPCRIVCRLEGLEWFLYNNAPAYRNIRDILGLSPTSTRHSSGVQSDQVRLNDMMEEMDSEDQTPNNVNSSLLMRLMPIQFECRTGALMVGNTDLKSMIVWTAEEVNGTYKNTRSRSRLDHYKSVIDLELIKTQVNIRDNMDYTNVNDTMDRLQQPSFKSKCVSYLSSLLFLSPYKKGHHENMNQSRDTIRETKSNQEDGGGKIYHDDYARVNHLIECNEIRLMYYADYAGPVPAIESANVYLSGGIDIGNGGQSPEWGLKIYLYDATLHYGPWTDRQRARIQEFFFPSAYRTTAPTAILKPGQQRMATEFQIHVEFANKGKLRIPTREKTKDWKYTPPLSDIEFDADGYAIRPHGWFDVKAAANSYAKVVIPFAIGPEGSTSHIDVSLVDVDITTSINYASLLQTKKLDVKIEMPAPLEWNGRRTWDFDVKCKTPVLFLLRDHIFLLQDLIKDWSSTPPVDLLHFTPTTYLLHVALNSPLVYLCVNEHNVIDNPNSTKDNAFLKVQTQIIKANIILPFTEFQPETTAIQFDVQAEGCSAGLSLQTSHTLNAFMSEDDLQAGSADEVTIDGSYEAFSVVNVREHIESCNLDIKVRNAKVKLFGSIIRYIFILKDNYFGAWNNFSTIEEYRFHRSNPENWENQKKKQADSKEISDPFEVYLLLEVENGLLLLPENLYECSSYTQIQLYELQLELRNLDIYMDMNISTSPITLTRDCSNINLSNARARGKSYCDPNNQIYIDGLNVYGHRLFGPLPDSLTYLCHWEFDIGKITGEMKPSLLLGIVSFGQTFVYNLIDEDNAVPQELETAPLPDVTFLKLYVQEINLSLMSINSATNVSIQDGILLEFDNLINKKYSQQITVKIPAIITRCLAKPSTSTVEDGNEFPWVEVANADLGFNITVLRHTASWKLKRKEQQKYIKTQDDETHRCIRLYRDADTASECSQFSNRSNNDTHTGVIYVPPFRPFKYGRVEDKSSFYPYASSADEGSHESLRGRGRGYSDASSISDKLYTANRDSGEEDLNDDKYSRRVLYDSKSIKSSVSNNDSFHTARNSTDLSGEEEDDLESDFQSNCFDNESVSSYGNNSFCTTDDADRREGPSPRLSVTAIPPSIPYSDYLRRYRITRFNSDFLDDGCYHPYMAPSRSNFIPEKIYNETNRSTLPESNESVDDLFSNKSCTDSHTDNYKESSDTYGVGNEVIATTVIEATRPIALLVTPIFVGIVQELAGEIVKDDWNLETMLDVLQIDYIEQLTRFLTNQYITTRFAVILPQANLRFIQNVTVPDDLTSYKHEESFIKTHYNTEDTVLCSVDINMKEFSATASVKFADYAFDEKQKRVVESNLVLQESRVHVDVGEIGSTVKYISKCYEQQSIFFGIPFDSLKNQSKYNSTEHDDPLVDELVVVDLSVKKFGFKFLNARVPNYAEIIVDSVDIIIITEAVEILAGAVYSWLVFVDDFKGILADFKERRSRQVQVFIKAVADFSASPAVPNDPPFLTTPITRLGAKNFRNDVGWKLLARMRHCLRCMPIATLEKLQRKLTVGTGLQDINSNEMFNQVALTFSRWRNWEIKDTDVKSCRLFTQPFNQKAVDNLRVQKDLTNEVVQFLTSSSNHAKIQMNSFQFAIFEEEMGEADNKISISSCKLGLECLYKTSGGEIVTEIQEPRDDMFIPPVMPDNYVDVVADFSVEKIEVSVAPIILAFARHMIMVQRVFTAKLRGLSHANQSISPMAASSSTDAKASSSTEDKAFDLTKMLSKIDIICQAIVYFGDIDIITHAQKLRMATNLSDIHTSALFYNPKTVTLSLSQQSDKADSDTGSAKRSSNHTARKNASLDPRLLMEATGCINLVKIVFDEVQTTLASSSHHEMQTKTSNTTLLEIVLERACVNANITQVPKMSKRYGRIESYKEVVRMLSKIHLFRIHAPQSLLRLYAFIEGWGTEQGRRYNFMFQNLLKEWEEQKKQSSFEKVKKPTSSVNASNIAQKKIDVKLDFVLQKLLVKADLLPSLSVEYNIFNFIVSLNETYQKSVPVRTYTIRFSEQMVHLETKILPGHEGDNKISSFSIPDIHSGGSLYTIKGTNQLTLASTISIGMISMSLDVSLIDSLLTAQSLMGNEMSDLIEVLSYANQKRNSKNMNAHPKAGPSNTPSPVPSKLEYCFDISIVGVCISAVSPSAILIFRSNLMKASVSDATSAGSNKLSWRIQCQNFSLSLDHNTVEDLNDIRSSTDDEVGDTNHTNCLAYILMDFNVQNIPDTYDPANNDFLDERNNVFINFPKIQTVMQPIALGKLAEMYIYYDAELKKKKQQKEAEVNSLLANTKFFVNSIKDDLPKVLQEESHSLLENKTIKLVIQRLGVAIPLDARSDVLIQKVPKNAGALLLTVSSIEFVTTNIEMGSLQLDNTTIQFVRKFDQTKDEHFLAENHSRMNHITLPSISCHVSAKKITTSQSAVINAMVGGFEVDVDGTIVDYINVLNVIYVKSMDRVDAFTDKSKSKSKAEVPAAPAVEGSEVIHLDIDCKFECKRGTVRMYPKRHSGDGGADSNSIRRRPGYDPKTGETSMASVDVPGLSAAVIYQLPLGAHASVKDSPKRFHADLLIRESNNILHPSLVQFLHEIGTGLKLGIQQSSERKADRDTVSETESNLNVSLFLRLSKTQLNLSCQPTFKVHCSLGWDEGEFLLNSFSKDTTSRTMSCVGSLRKATVVVKHQFSPEACLNAGIDHLLFNAMLTSQREGGHMNDDISIVVRLPDIRCSLDMKHLQDMLIINSCWFDRSDLLDTGFDTPLHPNIDITQPFLQHSTSEALLLNDHPIPRLIELPVPPPSNSSTNSAELPAPAPFSKHVAVSIDTMNFSIDLGKAIGKTTFEPKSLLFQLHHNPFVSKGLSLSLEGIDIKSKGRLSGEGKFEKTLIQGRMNVHPNEERSDASICIRSDGFKATYSHEYHSILDAAQKSLELNLEFKKIADKYDLQISLKLEALIARLSIRTVPVLISLTQRLKELIRQKKEEAFIVMRRPEVHSMIDLTSVSLLQPEEPKKESRCNKYERSAVFSKLTLAIQEVEVIIYPSQFHDSDNVDARAKDFEVQLEEWPRTEEGAHRKLRITLSSAALCKNVSGAELMSLLPFDLMKSKNLDGITLFGIPTSEIIMESTQLDRQIKYEFDSAFGGGISVSLNIGLIMNLQAMVNQFKAQVGRARQPGTKHTLNSPGDGDEEAIFFGSVSEESVNPPSAPETTENKPVYSPIMGPMVTADDRIDANPEITISVDPPPEEAYEYITLSPVNFQPQLQQMGEATPPVEWLGLNRVRLPGFLHEHITLPMDEVIGIVWTFLDSQVEHPKDLL